MQNLKIKLGNLGFKPVGTVKSILFRLSKLKTVNLHRESISKGVVLSLYKYVKREGLKLNAYRYKKNIVIQVNNKYYIKPI